MSTPTPAQPLGYCYACGEQLDDPTKFFCQTHDRQAEAEVIKREYGTVATFVAAHGYGPDNPATAFIPDVPTTYVKLRFPAHRQRDALAMLERERAERGARFWLGSRATYVRCYAAGINTSYVTVNPGRARLRLPRSFGANEPLARLGRTKPTWAVTIPFDSDEHIAKFHELAAIAAKRTQEGE